MAGNVGQRRVEELRNVLVVARDGTLDSSMHHYTGQPVFFQGRSIVGSGNGRLAVATTREWNC
jgi:hypothetical protein